MIEIYQLEFVKSPETKFIYQCPAGFEVRITRSGLVHRKSFSCRHYGGQVLSLKAAKAWRDEYLSILGPPRAHPYCMSSNKRNKTGKVGVSFVKRVDDGHLRVTAVVARWREDCGRFQSKSFSVKKWGFDKALQAAKTLREIKEEELQCYHQIDHLMIHEQKMRFNLSF